MKSTLDQARQTLLRGADLVDLAEAIGTILRDPESSLDDVRLGLRYGGVVGEQAQLELRRRQSAGGQSAKAGTVFLPGENSRDKPAAGTR